MGVITDTLGDIYRAARSILEGLWVTFVNGVMRRPVTEFYPYQRYEPYPTFRGVPALLTDEEGKPKCTGCGACARACPLGSITVKTAIGPDKKRVMSDFEINFRNCMLCNLCVESCAFDALGMARQYELATYSTGDLVLGRDRLIELGREVQPKKAGAATGPAGALRGVRA